MKNQLSIRLNQTISITPQLKQAIKLLQLNAVELQELIQTQAIDNPFLDLTNYQQANHKNLTALNKYLSDNKYKNLATNLEQTIAFKQSLQDYLRWQINLDSHDPTITTIANYLIDYIDDHGILTAPIEQIYAEVTATISPTLSYDSLLKIQKIIHHLDPVGCGVASSTQSLIIQAQELSPSEHMLQIITQILTQHLTLIANHNYPKLAKLVNTTSENIQQAIQLIKKMQPNPAYKFNNFITKYILPDLIALKHQQQWVVINNPNLDTNVYLDHQYIKFAKSNYQLEHDAFTKEKIQQAKWLQRSVQTRNESILKVANYIIHYQQNFLTHGDIALKPLQLADIAQKLQFNISTISRIINNKFIATNHGILPLKYFISHPIKLLNCKSISHQAFNKILTDLIKTEPASKPYSDIMLQKLLINHGINVARRTITKYRQLNKIPIATKRKYYTTNVE